MGEVMALSADRTGGKAPSRPAAVSPPLPSAQPPEQADDGNARLEQPPDMPAAMAPPPMPPETPEPRQPKSGKSGKLGILIVLFLIVVLVGAFFYLFTIDDVIPKLKKKAAPAATAVQTMRSRAFGKKKPEAPVTPEATNAAALPQSPLSAPVRQAQRVIADVLATREELPPPGITASNHPAGTPAASATLPPVTEPTNSTSTVTVPLPTVLQRPPGVTGKGADGKPPVAVPAVVSAEVIEWPEIEITAIIGGGKRGGVLINGEMIVIGEASTEGISLVKIEAQAAVLQYKGATHRFTVRKR